MHTLQWRSLCCTNCLIHTIYTVTVIHAEYIRLTVYLSPNSPSLTLTDSLNKVAKSVVAFGVAGDVDQSLDARVSSDTLHHSRVWCVCMCMNDSETNHRLYT